VEACWAAPLGECQGKRSREHIVSAGLWDGPSVTVVGLPWCKSEPKTVGVSSATARILCQRHNSLLSGADTAGTNAFRALKNAALLTEKRRGMRPRKWKVVRYEIDGLGLEQWFLKTLINVSVAHPKDGVWALSGTPLGRPPLGFIRASFGLSPLQRPLGLYAAGAVGEDVKYMDGVEIRTLLQPDGALAGALFTFLGFRFFLNLQDGVVPATFRLPSGDGWLASSVLYHISRLNGKVAGKLSHFVQFLWNLQ